MDIILDKMAFFSRGVNSIRRNAEISIFKPDTLIYKCLFGSVYAAL